MLDSALAAMGWVVSNYLIAGVEPQPHGNDNFTAAPSGAFRAGSGLLNIAANKQEQFEALVAAVGRDDLVTDPRFAAARGAQAPSRRADRRSSSRHCAPKPRANGKSLFNARRRPGGPRADGAAGAGSPQVRNAQLLKTFDDVPASDARDVLTRTGFKLSDGDPDVASPPPRSASTPTRCCAELGYDEAEIARRRCGSV